MALFLIKKAILSNQKSLCTTAQIFCNAARNHWNYQFQPGPYPKTAEERANAAKKYGLHETEYEPYPEEAGYGDYPKMPAIGADSKDPTYPYDNPEMKRNFNEPIHAQAEIFGEDRADPALVPRFPLWQQWTWLLSVLGGSFLLFNFLEQFKIGRPVTAKQYPKDGPHYCI